MVTRIRKDSAVPLKKGRGKRRVVTKASVKRRNGNGKSKTNNEKLAKARAEAVMTGKRSFLANCSEHVFNGVDIDTFSIEDMSFVGRGELTAEKMETFLFYYRKGLPINHCQALSNIADSTYKQWIARGRDYLNAPVDERNEEHRFYAVFLMMQRKVFADWEMEVIGRIEKDGVPGNAKAMGTWIRDVTLLERRDRANWARSDNINVTDNEDGFSSDDEEYL